MTQPATRQEQGSRGKGISPDQAVGCWRRCSDNDCPSPRDRGPDDRNCRPRGLRTPRAPRPKRGRGNQIQSAAGAP
eukprot:1994813-Pyramimonas_sp.AAC.1